MLLIMITYTFAGAAFFIYDLENRVRALEHQKSVSFKYCPWSCSPSHRQPLKFQYA